MYGVTVRRDFFAQHYLTVPNPGPEGTPHTHHYEIEIHLRGGGVDDHGYLVDIDAVNQFLDTIEDRYRDTLLNDLAEFRGDNPSVEAFAAIVAERFQTDVAAPLVDHIRVRVWEDDAAAGSFEEAV